MKMTEERFKEIRSELWAAEEKFKEAKAAMIVERRKRVPKIGELVRCVEPMPALGRYIGNNQVAYIDNWSTRVTKGIIDMEGDWSNYGNANIFPTDEDMIKLGVDPKLLSASPVL